MANPGRQLVSEQLGGIRTITLGASLKLYMGIEESAAWAASLAVVARQHDEVLSGRVRLFILPSLPALGRVAEAISGSPIELGAQDLFWEDRGPFTGGVSGSDLASLGCRYVEIGHSERRRVFGESAMTIRRKFAAAVRNELIPVLCVGEERLQDPNDAAAACIEQFESATADCDVSGGLVVAYEPEWAIGADEPASADHVVAVIERLRRHLISRALTDSPVIYGGSAKPGLLSTLGSQVDGLFLGRFAHDSDSFIRIIDEAAGIR